MSKAERRAVLKNWNLPKKLQVFKEDKLPLEQKIKLLEELLGYSLVDLTPEDIASGIKVKPFDITQIYNPKEYE